jgi:nicotinamidase-related amidase
MKPPRITAADSVLVIIDIQAKLLAKIPAANSLVANSRFLIEAAKLVGVPVVATEQYPKGLGPTVDAVAALLPGACAAKTAFSCMGAAGFLDQLRSLNRRTCVLAGMETHVCVLQTALDLLEAGFQVVLPVDALESRAALDKQTALTRLHTAGATLATVETVGFEWLGDAKHPQFKAFSKLVIERSEAS